MNRKKSWLIALVVVCGAAVGYLIGGASPTARADEVRSYALSVITETDEDGQTQIRMLHAAFSSTYSETGYTRVTILYFPPSGQPQIIGGFRWVWGSAPFEAQGDQREDAPSGGSYTVVFETFDDQEQLQESHSEYYSVP